MTQRVSDEQLSEMLKCTVEQSLGRAIIADLQDARREIKRSLDIFQMIANSECSGQAEALARQMVTHLKAELEES